VTYSRASMSARSDIWIPTSDGSIAAWLYKPDAVPVEGSPCVILAHGFTGVTDMLLEAPAERFAASGYAAVVFDYRHFGDSDGLPRQVLSLRRQYEDWDAVIGFARDLPMVDQRRIVLWGTSFSGGHVIDASWRHGPAAAIIQAPFTDGLSQVLATKKSVIPRLIAEGVKDQVRAWSGRKPSYVPVACEPGGYAVLPVQHVWDSIPKVVPPGSTWRNEVAGRIVLRLGTHRPVRHAKRVRCPLLVQVLEDETVLPIAPAKKASSLAGQGELLSYRGLDHFDIYVGDGFDRLNSDQLSFLTRHVPTTESTSASS